MKIALGSDHGGFDLKEGLKQSLNEKGIATDDVGCHSADAADYPDFAQAVASQVSKGEVDWGILICKSGIGMSISANRFQKVRAALCTSPDMAVTSREHNNANVLVLPASVVDTGAAAEIVDRFLGTPSSDEERHHRRVEKIDVATQGDCDRPSLSDVDPEVFDAIRSEEQRQADTINLIASENYTSRAVCEAQGSVMTNKYAEGYPRKRWYQGCRFVDDVETLAIDRAKELFGAEHVNVQPHSGSSANVAVYQTVLKPNDVVLAMSLAHGGHLTHGLDVNISGRTYSFVSYGVDEETLLIDYDKVAEMAREHKPRLIVAGASAYPRTLDFERFRAIADEVGAYLLVDMAHIAGLVAGGAHPSPMPYAEFVTTTTHKTLRGPRSGMIMCRETFGPELDRQIFPGLQGGPLMHAIAAKAVSMAEALRPEFKAYAAQTVANAQAMAATLSQAGITIVSGGTDNHLFLVDLRDRDQTGRDVAKALEKAGIVVNKNSIPFDTRSPFVTSGIRIGSPAMTTRGMKEPEMQAIGEAILGVLNAPDDADLLEATRVKMLDLTSRFPMP